MKFNATESGQLLFQRAEEIFISLDAATQAIPSYSDIQQLIHELRQNQIELEIQNENLRLTQQELEVSQRNYYDLFYLAPICYLTLNENGLIWKANLAASAMLGVGQHDLSKKPITSFILPEDQHIFDMHYKRHVTTKGPTTCVLRLVKKDGTAFWTQLSVSAVQNCTTGSGQNDNTAAEFLVTFSDISDHKQTEREQQKKNDALELLLYATSHDLRGPLVTVETFLGYLTSDMARGDKEQFALDLQYITNAADEMKQHLDDLMQLSRIDHMEPPPDSVSLKQVLAEVLETLAGAINERKPDIRLPDSDVILFGDRTRLCHIWQNLIENAIRYSREGSIPQIEVGIRQMGKEIVFFVQDKGIGIDHQYRSKIFGMFEKLNPKSPGAGLGLSVVRQLVEKCGGRIWVESEGADKGSCILFTLPNVALQI